MRRVAAVTVMVALLSIVGTLSGGHPTAVLAAPLVDANYIPGLGFAYTPPDVVRSPGQSFTVLRTGRLTRVGMVLSNHTGLPHPTEFRIHTLSALGIPTTTILATVPVEIPANTSQVWYEADLLSPLPVTAGQRLAVVLGIGTGFWSITGSTGDPYPAGYRVLRRNDGSSVQILTDGDFGFRTYVETVELRYSLSGTVSPNPSPLNLPLTFAFTATSMGNVAGANTVLRVDLPAGVQQSGPMTVLNGGVPVPGAACAVVGGGGLQITCSLGVMAVGASYTVSIPVRITTATPGSRPCARGIISGGAAGLTGMATAQACTLVAAGLPELSATLACDRPGNYDICTITVRNTGASAVALPFGRYIVQVELYVTGDPIPGITYFPKSGFLISTNFPNLAPFIFSWWSVGGQSIPSGGSMTFQFAMTGGSGQTYTGSIRIDHESAIAELNEGNNTIPIPLTTLP